MGRENVGRIELDDTGTLYAQDDKGRGWSSGVKTVTPSGDTSGGSDATAINAALTALDTAGGGVLELGPGRFWVNATITIPGSVWVRGAGIGGDNFSVSDAGFTGRGTQLVLVANANVDMLKTKNFATLTGQGNPSVYTIPARFKISDLVLDGQNYAFSGGNANGNTTARGLVVYGRDYRLDNVIIQNFGGDGWYSESRTVAGYAEESLFSNIRVTDCGGNGLTFKGPHDSQIVNAFFARCTGTGLQVLSTGGSFRATNVHNWGCGQYQFDIQNADSSFVNCTSDGAGTTTKTGVRVAASRVQWHGGSIYGSNNQGETGVLLGMGDGGTYTVQGCVFNTVWWNYVLGSLLLRYTSGIDTLTATHNSFGRFCFNSSNSRAVGGAGKTTVNGAQAGNSGTLTVADTTSFPNSGTLYVGAQGSGGSGLSSITYTGKTPTTFTGCSGGNASQTIPDGSVVFEQTGRLTNSNRETWLFESADEGSSFSIQNGFQGTNQSYFEGRSISFSGNESFTQSIKRTLGTTAYSASITPNFNSGEWQTVTVTDGTAFTLNAPTNPPSSTQTGELTLEVLNSSGGAMGAITWNAAFVFAGLSWTNPANGKSRFARFEWNGSKWICTALASADY